MDGKVTKVMASVIVALFCVGAFAAIFITDDSSADSTVTQKMYVEMIGDDGKLTDSQWLIFEFDGTIGDYITKANDAVKRVGLEKMVFSYTSGDYVTVTYDDGYNVATYIEKDGNWTKTDKTAEEYPATSYTMFAIGGWISHALYDSMTDAEKAKYTVDGTMGESWYAMKIPDKKVSDAPNVETYHVFLVLFDKGKEQKSEWISVDSLQDNRTFVANMNDAFKDKGWDKASLTYSAGKISMKYDGSGSNSSDYAKDGEWTRVAKSEQDYVNNTTLCLAFMGYITSAVYDTLSDSEKENWIFDFKYEETSYYYAKITEPTDGWEEKKNNNLVLYIVIGVVAVIAVAAVAFFVIKKKA